MQATVAYKPVAQLVDPAKAEVFDVLGPNVEYLTPLEADDRLPCVMRGTIPPGVVVPLHSHADPETFVMISGDIEGLTFPEDGFAWVRIRPGDVFYVPGGAKHAFRTVGSEPAVITLISTAKIGRFFQEIGTPIPPGSPPGPPSAEVMRHFQETAARYGYWNATPEENAQVGITLPGA